MKRFFSFQKGFRTLGLFALLLLSLLFVQRVVAAALFFSEHTVDEAFNGARDVYAADLDADGDLDLLGAAYDADEIAWWANNGDGTSWTKHVVGTDFNGAIAVTAADLDGDGDLDVLGAAYNGDAVTWWANNGDGTSWNEQIVDSEFNGAHDVYAADIDGDGDMDVMGAARLADDITWWANNGDGTTWTKNIVDETFNSARAVYAADIDGDNDVDILGAAFSDDDLTWWANNGDGTWTEHLVAGTFDGAHAVYAVDMDGDNDLDILGAASNGDDIAWWANNGDGSAWSEHIVDQEIDGPYDVYAADVDQDGDLDVLAAAHGADGLFWWENTAGDGTTWSKLAINDAFDGVWSVYAADIDGDNDVDVLGAATSADDISWWKKESGSPTGSLQQLVNDASAGDTIQLESGMSYMGGVTVDKALTINLNGATVGAGSPAFTITSPNVTILNGILDGTSNGSPAILVQSGGHNFTLQDTEVKNWVDGMQISGDVTSLKVVGNYIHQNSDAGLQVDSGVVIDGLITIEGNLFKDNAGHGIQNDGNTALPAPNNSWGDIDGADAASGGDGVSTNVEITNPTFAELFVAVNPGTEDTSRTVGKQSTFMVTVNVDATGLYGVQYQLTYSDTLLTLDSVADQEFKGSGSCITDTSTSGIVDVVCSRYNPDATASGALLVSELTFTANGAGLTGQGPWTNLFDISHLSAELAAGTQNGGKVYVNNGGFGNPSVPGLRTIIDENDGELIITIAMANYSGYIDREGRPNDSGVTLLVYDQEALSGATLLASATTTPDGLYTTAYEDTNQLTIGNSYYFQVDAPLHLPTTATSEGNYAHNAQLKTHPLTTLSTLVLLGGDATNDDTIALADATCIGGDFGGTTSSCVGQGANSDVNGDGQIDLLDLVLMANNYSKSSSPWTPSGP
ncbi:MAG: FG-GAP-like repeat-containing protein [Ardenticatenaceae bacterium]